MVEIIFPTNATQGGEQTLKVEGQKFVNGQPVTFGEIDIYMH